MKTRSLRASHRALCILLTLITIIAATSLSAYAKSSDTITETVNLANIRENTDGAGYEWNNMTNTLTLSGLNIVTDDEFGLKLPSEATVVLKGKNHITASSCALVCTGMTTFTGSGSLTVVSGETGINCTSAHESDLIRFTDGKIAVSAARNGIVSENSTLSVMGSKVSIKLSATEGNRTAISGRNVSVSAGFLTANASIKATASLSVSAAELSVSSSEPALICNNGIKLSNVSIKTGNDTSSLANATEYASEHAVSLTSNAKTSKRGILFNADYPRFLDYLVFILLIALTAAVIVVPFYLKRKRTQKLIEAYNAANPPKKQPKTKKK